MLIKIIQFFCFTFLCFFLGLNLGTNIGIHQAEKDCAVPEEQVDFANLYEGVEATNIDSIVEQRFEKELALAMKKNGHTQGISLKFAAGISKVNKDLYAEVFDYGIPMDPGNRTNEEHALLFYTQGIKSKLQMEEKDGVPQYISDPKHATKYCDAMNTVFTKGDSCIAIVEAGGGLESFHLHRWRRPEISRNKLSLSEPMNSVNRFNTKYSEIKEQEIKQHEEMLKKYLQHFTEVLNELKPLTAQVANKRNEIIVMTSNFGQSALLTNFVCNSRARNLDISNVLVFPTDKQTHDLAIGLGLASFYDERNFENFPEKEANFYGDRVFVSMMFAKVISVQLINYLGYHVLFQDVDIVWYKNPLEEGYFTNKSSPLSNFDMLFQDDGARSLRYSPYCANSGFYYVRHNQRTKYFFTQFLAQGALIRKTNSHQHALIQTMNEHTSLFGLRVKTLDKFDFPGGWNYHRKKDFMKDIAQEKVVPPIFHMSWTKNKENKILFMKQMGMWRVNEQCMDKTIEKIPKDENIEQPLLTSCCAVEPLISCHYKDKPSIVPCKESPPIDKGRPSFW